MGNQPRWRRRVGGAVLGAVVAGFAACREHIANSYGPAPDAAAMAALESAWSQVDGLSLTLCEDLARSESSPPDGCQVEHVVRGGGVGLEQTVSHSGGCGMGGCPYGNQAYVRGTAAGAGLPGAAAVSGVVILEGGYSEDPYAYPYGIELTCDDAAAPCTITGTLAADGRVEALLLLGAPGSGAASTRHVLERTGAAACR